MCALVTIEGACGVVVTALASHAEDPGSSSGSAMNLKPPLCPPSSKLGASEQLAIKGLRGQDWPHLTMPWLKNDVL